MVTMGGRMASPTIIRLFINRDSIHPYAIDTIGKGFAITHGVVRAFDGIHLHVLLDTEPSFFGKDRPIPLDAITKGSTLVEVVDVPTYPEEIIVVVSIASFGAAMAS
jgi:hypothetical protein